MQTLTNGKLLVQGEMTDVFEVKIKEIRIDMMIEIELIPNDYTRNNGIEEEYLTVDVLNETIIEVLKENGYMIIEEKSIPMIQN